MGKEPDKYFDKEEKKKKKKKREGEEKRNNILPVAHVKTLESS